MTEVILRPVMSSTFQTISFPCFERIRHLLQSMDTMNQWAVVVCQQKRYCRNWIIWTHLAFWKDWNGANSFRSNSNACFCLSRQVYLRMVWDYRKCFFACSSQIQWETASPSLSARYSSIDFRYCLTASRNHRFSSSRASILITNAHAAHVRMNSTSHPSKHTRTIIGIRSHTTASVGCRTRLSGSLNVADIW